MDGAYTEAIAVARQRATRADCPALPPGVRGVSSARRILLVAYFYPPCRDTGVLRPAAMAKWLRRAGHEVTVLTTSAYGTEPTDDRDGVVRTNDLQRWRARLAGKEHIDALFDSDTYSGAPHPLSKVVVPEALAAAWMPFARSRALALNREQRFDCRDHDFAAGVGSRRRHRAATPRRALGRRRPRRLDLRVASSRVPDRGPAPARPAPRAPLARRRRRRRLRLRARGRRSAPARDRRAAADPQRLGSGDGAVARGRSRSGPRPRARLAPLHRPLRQLRARSASARRRR